MVLAIEQNINLTFHFESIHNRGYFFKKLSFVRVLLANICFAGEGWNP
jgi:hypothetical protein